MGMVHDPVDGEGRCHLCGYIECRCLGGALAMIPQDEWEWFGNAGHFICGSWCRFHLCTAIGPWLISTVGEYVHPRHGMGSEMAEAKWLEDNAPGEDIGAGRKYETMVFRIGSERCSSGSCGCGMPLIDGHEIDFLCHNTAGFSAAGHMEMCRKYAAIKAVSGA